MKKIIVAILSALVLSAPLLAEATQPYPNGTLVNDKGTIFLIMGMKKIPFSNYNAFKGLGYSLKNVVSADLSQYNFMQTQGINSAELPHTWGSWIKYGKTIYYSAKEGMVGVPSWDIFVSNGGDSKFVVTANKHDLEVLKRSKDLQFLIANDQRVASTHADADQLANNGNECKADSGNIAVKGKVVLTNPNFSMNKVQVALLGKNPVQPANDGTFCLPMPNQKVLVFAFLDPNTNDQAFFMRLFDPAASDKNNFVLSAEVAADSMLGIGDGVTDSVSTFGKTSPDAKALRDFLVNWYSTKTLSEMSGLQNDSTYKVLNKKYMDELTKYLNPTQ